MSKENINKHGVDLSKLVAGKSVITFYHDEKKGYDDEKKGVYTGTYLMPGAEGWLIVQFGHDKFEVDPDYVLSISEPDSRWE